MMLDLRMNSARPYRSKKSDGFSLVELMIALVVGLIVILGAGQLFFMSLQSFGRMDSLAQRQESLRYIVDVMSDDVRSAFNPYSQYAYNVSEPPNKPYGHALPPYVSAVKVSEGGRVMVLEYYDDFSLRGRDGLPYCTDSQDEKQIEAFVGQVDDLYFLKYEFDEVNKELLVSHRCGWVASDSPGSAPYIVFSGGGFSQSARVATGVKDVRFQMLEGDSSVSGVNATLGVELEFSPLGADDEGAVFNFVITNRIRALSTINAGLKD